MMLTNTIYVPFCLPVLIGTCLGCNIDTSQPKRYTGDTGSYFGYTVLQHQDKEYKYLFIGAPRGNSSDQPNLVSPGAVYKCGVGRSDSCDQIHLDIAENEDLEDRHDNKNHQWLGVSLARQNIRSDGLITTCGHRYSNDLFLGHGNVSFEKNDSYPIGACFSFKMDPNRINEVSYLEKTFPCLGNGIDDQWREDPPNDAIRWLSWCQAGIDAAATKDGTTILYGAPGAYNWTGTIIPEVNNAIITANIPDRNVFNSSQEYRWDYVGYAVTTGHFVGQPSDEQGVAGAPRAKGLLGKVTIYEVSDNTIYQELYGESMGTYFGSALASVDVNGDSLDDLLVGAPSFSDDQDEGKVYVYLNTGSVNEPLQLSNQLQGSKAPKARFGTSISSAGDINQDGYNDVIIGAPYEGKGAIYLYLGGANGINPTYSQRILVEDLSDQNDAGFGISVHGSLDMDGNGYPDVLIGAYESSTAFYLRTKPLLDLEGWLLISPQSVDPDMKTCMRDGEKYVCINVTACFRFTNLDVEIDLDVDFSIVMDEGTVAAGIDSRILLETETRAVANRVEGTHYVTKEITSCTRPYRAFLSKSARDLVKPVPVKLTYDIFKYDLEIPRGDIPPAFPKGVPPLLDSGGCGPKTFTDEIIFVQDCGIDAICQTDIIVAANVQQLGSSTDSLILGASRTIDIKVKIDNAGESAHQTVMRILHPSDMGYETMEILSVTCLPLAQETGADCTPEVVALCTPEIGQDASAIVLCNLGNPMHAYNSVSLRLQFDVSAISWSVGRVLDIAVNVSTVSVEGNTSNNGQQLNLPLIVEADLAVIGVSQPEAVYYGYNGTSMGYPDQEMANKAKLKAALEAVDNFYGHGYDPSRYNETHIGPAFNLEYQVVNYGRGRLPLTSNLVIQVPFTTQDKHMLLFIKAIKIAASQGSCNQARILDLQQRRIEEFYQDGGGPEVLLAEEQLQTILIPENSERKWGCSKANCVEVLCNISPLEKDEFVKITIEALLWEYTFATHDYGLVEVLTGALVMSDDKDGIHTQPQGHQPDKVAVITTAYTASMGSQPVSWWVIFLAILLGLVLLSTAVLVMWKLGFFKRQLKDEMNAPKGEHDAERTETDPGHDTEHAPEPADEQPDKHPLE